MHVLQKLALRTPRNATTLRQDSEYDTVRGVWLLPEGSLVADDPDEERTSKKNDVETGEDLKGQ